MDALTQWEISLWLNKLLDNVTEQFVFHVHIIYIVVIKYSHVLGMRAYAGTYTYVRTYTFIRFVCLKTFTN